MENKELNINTLIELADKLRNEETAKDTPFILLCKKDEENLTEVVCCFTGDRFNMISTSLVSAVKDLKDIGFSFDDALNLLSDVTLRALCGAYGDIHDGLKSAAKTARENIKKLEEE